MNARQLIAAARITDSNSPQHGQIIIERALRALHQDSAEAVIRLLAYIAYYNQAQWLTQEIDAELIPEFEEAVRVAEQRMLRARQIVLAAENSGKLEAIVKAKANFNAAEAAFETAKRDLEDVLTLKQKLQAITLPEDLSLLAPLVSVKKPSSKG